MDPLVEIAIPVYNEKHVLAHSVRRLHRYLEETFPYRFQITIADNASIDGTWQAALELEAALPHVRAVRLEQKGRGRALRHVWSRSDADVVAYMDVDLSTDLDAFLPLAARFTDAQYGFKAARTVIARALLPSVQDEKWFFDTELLLLAECNGLRIHEVPVDWVDDPDSRVDVLRTALDDVKCRPSRSSGCSARSLSWCCSCCCAQ